MDAGAADPLEGRLRPARPEEGESKPKSQETQDDGYETSNSGDALRRKHASSPEPSPPAAAPTAPAPLDPMPPPERAPSPPPPAPPSAPEDRYDALDLHRSDPYPHYQRQFQPQPFKREFEEHEPYYRREYFPQPDVYAAFAAKRDHDAPYDMTQQYNGIKRECEDPYSFVDEEAMCAMLGAPGPPAPLPPPHMQHQPHPHMMHQQMMLNQPKKRGRKKKIKDENGMEIKVEAGMEGAVGAPRPVKERKKHDRFNGMSEEEVSRRTLPDHLAENLDIIIIGINPGLFAAYKGHHYAGPGNHFWKCLYLSGLTREQMSADEDYKLLNFGIGFTNMVSRATKGSADLTRREIKEGGAVLLEKLQTFRPKVAVFNGKLIYEVFSGKKDFCFGKQPDTIAGTNTYMWVMPSSSARCAQLPRAADKVPFYAALKKFRDYLNGLVAHVEEGELVFPDTTGRRPQEELEIRRLTMEPEPGDTIILEDGTEVPIKKKRGRPKKIKLENGEVAPPTPRAPRQPRAQAALDSGGEQPPKKKRGRPKKIRPEEQQFLLQQQNQQLLTQQLPMQTMTPQQSVDTQYGLGDDFQSQGLNDQLAQNTMMYQTQQVMGQAQDPTGPYFRGPTGAMDPGPLDMCQSAVGPPGALQQMQRPQAGYAQSPGSYSQSPRPQNSAYGQSPRPQGYSQSPQRHRSATPSYSNSPVPGAGGTPQPTHSPFPQSPAPQSAPFSQTSPQRPQSRNLSYSSPVGNPYSRSPVPQTYSQPQQSPMYAQSPANAGYSQSSPSQGVFASQSPAPNGFSQSPAPMGRPYSGSPVPQPLAQQGRPYSRSPAPQGAPFPQHSPAPAGSNPAQSYTPSPAHTPYSQHSSPAAGGAGRTPGYAHSPQFGGPSPLHSTRTRTPNPSYGADLSGDISAAISSPGPVSPGMGHIDFEPPIAANKIRVGEGSSLGSQENSPMGSTDMHAGSNSNSSLSDFNKPGSAGGPGPPDMSPGAPAPPPYMFDGEQRLQYSLQDKGEVYHYTQQDQGGSGVGSPRLEQLHSHPPMYPNTYSRSTPPAGPFSPHYRPAPADHAPGSPGEFSGAAKTKSQDVASKSLSGLESLVDQIPSIAEGAPPSAPPPPSEGAPPPAPVAPPPEAYPALYGPYGYGGPAYPNNAYGPPFVGYGAGGWGTQLMRPTPGYLGEAAWLGGGGQYAQYGAASAYPPPNYAPYYNGYGPPSAHHQQYLSHASHHLSLELHKPPDPAVPSVPSVGFGGFC